MDKINYDVGMQTLRRTKIVKPLKDTSTIAELIERLKDLNMSPITQIYFDIRTESFFNFSHQKETRVKKMRWKDLPVCGMWSDRNDMKDPSAYVRKLRKPRYEC